MIIGIDGIEANVEQKVGVSVYTAQLLSYFHAKADKNTQFLVYLRSAPVANLPKETEYFKYEVVRQKGLWRDLFFPLHLYLHKKIDVLFCPAHYIPRFCPVPTVVTIHDLAYEFFPNEFKKEDLYKLKNWTRHSVERARNVIAVSKTTAEDLHKLYGVRKEKIATIYNGYASIEVPSNEELDSFGLKPQKYFLYIGTLQPRKNIPTLIQAFSKFHKKHPDIKLAIIGRKGWMYDSIFEEVKRLNIEDSIIFTGYVKCLKMFYTNAIAYILPSLYEGFGLPVIEAMHYECPVIVSDTPALMEVSDGACLNFPAHDTMALAQALEKVIDPSVNKTLIEKGKMRAKDFSWKKTAQKTLEILTQS
ncbi:glycosyltransferase family 4 protein [Candidatus Woesebacteria bacterium]|nr:glycosyltransferase family 4 protein [Candidatus Woesebacteria bacterium]